MSENFLIVDIALEIAVADVFCDISFCSVWKRMRVGTAFAYDMLMKHLNLSEENEVAILNWIRRHGK